MSLNWDRSGDLSISSGSSDTELFAWRRDADVTITIDDGENSTWIDLSLDQMKQLREWLDQGIMQCTGGSSSAS